MSGPSTSSIEAYAALRFGLQGRTALVTGGTKGIGAAVVEHFARLGARVFICSRNAEDVAARVAEWRGQGLDVQGCAADVSQAADRASLMAAVSSAFSGSLNILVNNVGTNIRKPTVEYSEAEFSSLLSTNLGSAYTLCQAAHALLKASGDGVVLFNSSVAGGPTAMRSGSIYALTKAALNQLARNLACEWAGDGIRALSIAPWYTSTDLANQVLANETFKSEVLSRTPMRRIATPDDVAAAFAFFASPAARHITGQTLAVDGGYSVMGMY